MFMHGFSLSHNLVESGVEVALVNPVSKYTTFVVCVFSCLY